ncbi:MAG: site-specific integrase [candidate division NC10 bacterium]|nr:site-specific integrase [candidate division NC10 bacterium]
MAEFTVKLYCRKWTTNGEEREAWGVRYRLNGKYKSEIVGDLKLAKIRERQLHEDHKNGLLGVGKDKTFSDLVAPFLEDKRNYGRDLETIELRVRNLAKQFDGVALEDITAEAISTYIGKRKAEGVSGATVNRELAVLRNMLRMALEWDWLRRERKFKMLPEGPGRDRELTEAEEKALLPHLKPAFVDLMQAALCTGMREGELIKLTWTQVDLAERVLDFPPTKRGEKRLMPINESLYYILLRRKGAATSAHVFTRPDGTPWSKWAVHYHLKKGIQAAGIAHLWFHDLRHTVASRLNRNGVSASYVQDLLGHKTANMTRRYTHTQAADLQAALATLTNHERESSNGLTPHRNSAS